MFIPARKKTACGVYLRWSAMMSRAFSIVSAVSRPHPRITALLDLLRSQELDDQIVSTKTLCKLSLDPTWRTEIVKCGAVSPLLRLTKSSIPRLQRDSALCLIQLSANCHPKWSFAHGTENLYGVDGQKTRVVADTDTFYVTDSMCASVIDAILRTVGDSSVDVTPVNASATEKLYLHTQDSFKQVHSSEYSVMPVLSSLEALLAISESFPSQRDYMLAQDAVVKLLPFVDRGGSGAEERAIKDTSLRLLYHLCCLPALLSYVERPSILWLVGALSHILSAETRPYSVTDHSGAVTHLQKLSWTELAPSLSSKVLAVRVLCQLARCAEVRPLIVHAGGLVDLLEIYDTLMARCNHLDTTGSPSAADEFAGAPEMLLDVMWAVHTLAECTSFSRELLREGRFAILQGVLSRGSLVAKECIASELQFTLQRLQDEEDAAVVSCAAKDQNSIGGVAGWGEGTGEDVVCAVEIAAHEQRAELARVLCRHDYLPALMTALDDGSPRCVQYVAGSLRHFAEAGRDVQGLMVSAGVVRRMMHILSHFSDRNETYRSNSESEQTSATRVIQLLSEDSSTHAELCAEGGVEILSNVLMTEFLSREARKCAAIALSNLSSSSNVKDVLSPATRTCLELFLEEDVFKWM